MAFSNNNKLESKEFIGEVVPSDLLTTIGSGMLGIRKLIYDYSCNTKDRCPDKSLVWLKNPITSCTFFGFPSSREQILAGARHAAPPEQLITYIRKAHGRGETHIKTTHEEAILITIVGLDVTIGDNRGLAETLLKLYAELYPDDYLQIVEKAKLAAPLETPEDKENREACNSAELNTVFTAFQENNEVKMTAAIKAFTGYVSDLKKLSMDEKSGVMINNKYHLNLIHLIYGAFNVLVTRGRALPRVVGDKPVQEWYGKLADQFCFKIIGALQIELPPRVRQLVRAGIYDVFFEKKVAERILDIEGAIFRAVPDPADLVNPSDLVVGENSFYNDIGASAATGWLSRLNGVPGPVFLMLARAITASSKICYTATAHSLIASLPDNIEIQRSPAATAAAKWSQHATAAAHWSRRDPINPSRSSSQPHASDVIAQRASFFK